VPCAALAEKGDATPLAPTRPKRRGRSSVGASAKKRKKGDLQWTTVGLVYLQSTVDETDGLLQSTRQTTVSYSRRDRRLWLRNETEQSSSSPRAGAMEHTHIDDTHIDEAKSSTRGIRIRFRLSGLGCKEVGETW
jgi:hypothetical protein